MSFCSDVKNELAKLKPSKCCREPLCYGFLLFSRFFSVKKMGMQTENEGSAYLYAEMIKRVYGADVKVSVGGSKRPTYKAEVVSEGDRLRILASVDFGIYDGSINREPFLRECCSAAFIRGAFLACGHISDPNLDFRADFSVKDCRLAEELVAMLSEHYITAKISKRGNGFVVYIKRSEMLINLLAVMGASARSLEFIEMAIEKEANNQANRKFNFDSTNINRTVETSVKQTNAIMHLKKIDYFESMPEELIKAANLRLENPGASLKELCNASSEPITVSGLNHRLKKIMDIYEQSLKKSSKKS